MRNILMGVAAIALAAGGAYAQPGNGNGKNHGAAAAQHKGNGNAKADRGPKMAQAQGPGKADKGPNKGKPDHVGNGKERSFADHGKADHPGKSNASAMKGKGDDRIKGKSADYRGDRYDDDYDRRGKAYKGKDRRYDDDDGLFGYRHRDELARGHGLINGCPPGVDKRNNGCTPPGLLKQRRHDYDRAGWWRLPGLTGSGYRYYDNHLVRLSPTGSILGYYPLLGGALSTGNVWPSWFDYQPVPRYYESYYGLGPSGSYRYADNALYRVDPETAAITSIAALLTGDSIRVGQPMPMGYSVYNVPYGYRDRYVDGPNAMYRYSDGYVYEVDPSTMLVASAIELLI